MQTVQANKLYKVAHVDPAGGATVQRSTAGLSRSSIVVIGQDNLERVFILQADAKRMAPDRLIDWIFDTQLRHRPAIFGIDSSGPQSIFAQLVAKEARERGIRLPLRPVNLRSEKTFSIETTLQPVSSSGRLFRPPEMECRTLQDEWRSFPDGVYRDTLDALACAIRLLPSVLPEHLRNMGREQLRRYLERTGMPRDEIERRLIQRDEYGIEST